MLRPAPLAFCLLPMLACGSPEEAETHQPGDEFALTTDQGLYLLHIQMDPDPPVTGDATLSLMVHDAATDDMLMGAALTVTPWMPEHDHGVAEDPLVTEDGGFYTVTFAYSMPGTWELTFDVDGELGADSGSLTVEVQ